MEAPRYIELKPKEEVLEVVRGSLFPKFWLFTLLTLLSVLPFFFLFPLWRQGTWGIVVFFIWLVCALVFLWRVYLQWSRTVLLVTDMRVVDHDQRGFFHRVVTEARFEQIDEVSVRVKGLFPTLLRYGTLRLKLHGEAADIDAENVKRPDHLADILNDLRRREHAGS